MTRQVRLLVVTSIVVTLGWMVAIYKIADGHPTNLLNIVSPDDVEGYRILSVRDFGDVAAVNVQISDCTPDGARQYFLASKDLDVSDTVKDSVLTRNGKLAVLKHRVYNQDGFGWGEALKELAWQPVVMIAFLSLVFFLSRRVVLSRRRLN